MPSKMIKLVSAAEAAAQINDGDSVAIGGSLIRRHPMALIHEMIRQNKKDLTIYGWNNSFDFDMLIGCGLVKEAQSSYVGLANVGLAKNFRRVMQNGALKFVEMSETVAMDKFRAGAEGKSFAISKSPLNNDMRNRPEYYKDIECPFTGERWAAIEAFHPDVAIMHGHRADKYGNVQLDTMRLSDNDCDIFLVKSAKKVIVSVEEIVEEEEIVRTAHNTVLPKLFVDAVVHAPFGAHPNSCDTRYDFDITHARHYQECSETPERFRAYIEEFVLGCEDWDAYLAKIGEAQLKAITRD